MYLQNHISLTRDGKYLIMIVNNDRDFILRSLNFDNFGEFRAICSQIFSADAQTQLCMSLR